MDIRLTQKKLSANYRYDIEVNGEQAYHAKANRTILPLLRKVEVHGPDDKAVLTIKEKDYWLKFTARFSLYGCPFVIEQDGAGIGWIREWFKLGQPVARAEVRHEQYDIYIHRNNRISVRRGGAQVGLITREAWKQWDGDRYAAAFDDDIPPLTAASFLLFTDIAWFTSDTSAAAYQKTEYYPIKGVEEEPDWKPKTR